MYGRGLDGLLVCDYRVLRGPIYDIHDMWLQKTCAKLKTGAEAKL